MALLLPYAKNLKGLELDDSSARLSPSAFQSLLDITTLQQLTLTHTALPDAGLLFCDSAVCTQCLRCVNLPGSCPQLQKDATQICLIAH